MHASAMRFNGRGAFMAQTVWVVAGLGGGRVDFTVACLLSGSLFFGAALDPFISCFGLLLRHL